MRRRRVALIAEDVSERRRVLMKFGTAKKKVAVGCKIVRGFNS